MYWYFLVEVLKESGFFAFAKGAGLCVGAAVNLPTCATGKTYNKHQYINRSVMFVAVFFGLSNYSIKYQGIPSKPSL